jgi:hypothetical protein
MLHDAGEAHIRRCSRFVLKAQEGAFDCESGALWHIIQGRVFPELAESGKNGIMKQKGEVASLVI